MPAKVAGVLLAGGLSRRMGGGDKCLRILGGKTILARVIARARPQVAKLVLNANGDPARFGAFDLPVAADLVGDHAGPLAGVLTGLAWAGEQASDCQWVASFACDAPFLPMDLVERMLAAVAEAGADMACATSKGRAHPVFGLWPVALQDQLRQAMVEEEIRKVDLWTGRYRLVTVDFPEIEIEGRKIDPFFNTNRPEDLEEAERLLV